MEAPAAAVPKAMIAANRKKSGSFQRTLQSLMVLSVWTAFISLMQRCGMAEMMDFLSRNDKKTEDAESNGECKPYRGRYRALWQLLRNNIVIYSVGYGLPYAVLHCTTYYWHKKFNQRPTPSYLFRKELRRWFVSCWIGAAVDFSTKGAMAVGLLPRLDAQERSWPRKLLELAFVGIWSDLHFYVMHRSMHNDWLYKHIHRFHHESFNPNPFSGLSFHPVEALAYFSAVPMYVLLNALLKRPTTAWAYVALKLINDLGPSAGHDGYTSVHHYLHHTKKHWNFGATPIFDEAFGTILKENPFTSKWVGTP